MSVTLRTDEELFAAALLQQPVTVWKRFGIPGIHDEKQIDEGGIVEKITPISVRLRRNDGSKTFVLRTSNVEFRI